MKVLRLNDEYIARGIVTWWPPADPPIRWLVTTFIASYWEVACYWSSDTPRNNHATVTWQPRDDHVSDKTHLVHGAPFNDIKCKLIHVAWLPWWANKTYCIICCMTCCTTCYTLGYHGNKVARRFCSGWQGASYHFIWPPSCHSHQNTPNLVIYFWQPTRAS